MLAARDAYRAQEWVMLIQECSASGLTKREFCQQRGIWEKSFYYWLRKLRTQMVASCGTSDGAVKAGSDYGRYAPDPVPRSRTEVTGRCGYGCCRGLAPLYSIAMIDLTKVRSYYIACGYTDLRLGIDGLAAVVTQQLFFCTLS